MSANSPLEKYRIKSSSERWSSQYETEEWVLVYIIPEDKRDTLKPYYKVSIDNILPGHDTTDPYAPCINESGPMALSEAYPGHYELPVVYRRPPINMILQPGRGICGMNTYASSRTKEIADIPTSLTQPLSSNEIRITDLNLITKSQIIESVERGTLIVQATNWEGNENTLLTRALAWIGMGGSFKYRGKLYTNLKLAAVDIGRRASNAAVVDSTWQFAQNPSGWKASGTPTEYWQRVEYNTREVARYVDPLGNNLAIPGQFPGGDTFTAKSYVSIKLREVESEVIRGSASFTPIESYFSWMTRS
jgi:hypothetical protein